MAANVWIAGLPLRRMAGVVFGIGLWTLAVANGRPAWSQAEPTDADGVPAAPVVSAAASPDIARLVAQLDDDEYRVRQEATRKLAYGGAQAVGPLAKVAAGNNLESAYRALAALKELGCSEDVATEEAAFAALDSLAGESSATAVRAQKVLAGMRVASQHRAKERLRELGATISDNNNNDEFGGPVFIGGGGVIMARGGVVFVGGVDGNIYVSGTSVEIGEKWTGKDDDLRLLRRLDGVGQIVLAGEQVTDKWLEKLANLPATSLQRVELRRTKVTDVGLAYLASFTSVVRVDILYTPITDAAVETLAKFVNAQYIRVYGTKITTQGANQLTAKLPNARIDRRGGALLGVGGSIGEPTCTIHTVQPDSAAAKAGILVGDTILKFDGTAVQDFTELTAAISEKIGGEEVEIELLRPNVGDANPTAKKVTVTLGEW